MTYKLLLVLLAANCSIAVVAQFQPVSPIESSEYLKLIAKKDSTVYNKGVDTSSVNFLYTKAGVYSRIRQIRRKGNTLSFSDAQHMVLKFSGSYSGTAEIKSVNRTPALQNNYVQGRSINGMLQWQGPETNEFFSFGPSISDLEYDGSNYEYDENGRLVALGSGKGIAAVAFSPSILRTGFRLSNAITFAAQLYRNSISTGNITLRAGQHFESTLIKQNNNAASDFQVNASTIVKRFIVSGNMQFSHTRFDISNRNGILNRIYQSDLLTPISFNNKKGIQLSTGNQRSFSSYADNPYFLLNSSMQGQEQMQSVYGISVKRNLSRLQIQLDQSYVRTQVNDQLHLQPGTAFFQQEFSSKRNQKDEQYNARLNSIYQFRGGYHFDGNVRMIYNYSASGTDIFNGSLFINRYKRFLHELNLSGSVSYEGKNIRAAINAGNGTYISNTASHNDLFVPSAGAYILFHQIFQTRNQLKISAGINQVRSELPISRSFYYMSRLGLNTSQALQSFPGPEVSSFKNLKAVKNNEITAAMELYNYRSTSNITLNFYYRKVMNDVFPVLENNRIILQNLAAHHTTGYEISLNLFHYTAFKASLRNMLSFSRYHNKVDEIYNRQEVILAGFSNVHKSLVKGYPLGVIVGECYKRNDNGKMIIGQDGFPIVDNGLYVIGDPTPKFSMKLSNVLQAGAFNINIDLEWKHGGETWNGTQAVLDYYGRSQRSAIERNIRNYIFPGVMENGQPNNIPVDFYDISKPFEQNRWLRYGYSGVAEDHIETTSQVRLNNIAASYEIKARKYFRAIKLTAYASNIIVWSSYKGADARQYMYDEPVTAGLDCFNIPSSTSYGFNISLQF